ncbi:MAG: ATP-dependent DNA helicase RecG [Nitrospirota bacterium]
MNDNTDPKKVQATQPSSASHASLRSSPSVEAYLLRLARPVDFAIRDGGRGLAVVRNLGAFLVHCAAEGLAIPRLRSIHADLERLSALASTYDGLSPPKRRERLEAVREVLSRMSRRSLGGRTASVPESNPGDRGLALSDAIEALPGIGVRRAALLRTLGIERVEDLLWQLPWRYEDRAATTPLAALRVGQDVTVCGEVNAVDEMVTARRRLRILRAILSDGSGTVTLKWFNQPYLRRRLAPGQQLMCSGRVKGTGGLLFPEIDNPQFEVMGVGDSSSLHTGRVVPVYHETRGLTSRVLRVLVDRVLTTARGLNEDCLPASIRDRHGLIPKQQALRTVHFPPPDADLAQYTAGIGPAHRRLAFEELLLLQLGLVARRRQTERDSLGITFECSPGRLARFWTSLPFEPTAAQRRVVDEVRRDMTSSRPMNRLIHGDVGCGKTVVAAAAIWMAVGDGYQAAVMAPTELLAEQHFRQLSNVLGGLGVRVALLTSESPRRDRRLVLDRLASGDIDCVVGTHALLQPGVRFARFGLAVVDEQHKFGVLQRSHLVRKGYHPDVLIMTATPIPRTLAITVYGDLDVSVIDEMPVGRIPVETRWYREAQRPAANEAVRQALARGRQVYVVAPRIDESDDGEIRSVAALAERLGRECPGARVGLLHGRLNRSDKDAAMQAFLSRRLEVLVATTVVEVGIDVPNATVMVIEHADRFGLAQLHQLRGRVGRGAHASLCLLLSPDRVSEEARQRLETMQEVRDGFLIAERDLEMRGPGEFLGTRQSGVPDLKVAKLTRDARLVDLARREAFAVLDTDPTLSLPEHALLRTALKRAWGTRFALATVG